jgi:hypothetical protein
MSCCPPSIVPDFADGGGGGGAGGVQSVTGGTNITVTGTLANPVINSSGSTPRPAYTIFVSPSGDDLTADGSISLPFKTIQGGINFRNGLSNTANIEIFIFAGTYTENLTINSGNTYFTTNPSQYKDYKTVIINGTVIVDITNFTSQGSVEVCFAHLQWTSTSFITGSTANQGLQISFTNCYWSGFALHNQNSTQGCIVRYTDCYLQHTGTESLIISVGCSVQIWRCEMYHQNASINPIINIQNGGGGGSGSLNIQYCNIRSVTTSATAQPIIRFQNTSPSTSGNIMNYNSMTFTSSTVDVGQNKCCVQFFQTGAVTFDFVSFNSFDCDGAVYTGGQPYAIQKRGAGAVTFNVSGGNYGGQTAHTIDPAIVRTSSMILL